MMSSKILRFLALVILLVTLARITKSAELKEYNAEDCDDDKECKPGLVCRFRTCLCEDETARFSRIKNECIPVVDSMEETN
ncbi:unnamed protein product [Allacma fusca]|uniref:Uncharacterized protein n=1 Tax=Allacma fusca TaxID=39272 RepID=A0A8J2K2Y0_9HEXA|nr:unnamed protein product [Allacma fusca]